MVISRTLRLGNGAWAARRSGGSGGPDKASRRTGPEDGFAPNMDPRRQARFEPDLGRRSVRCAPTPEAHVGLSRDDGLGLDAGADPQRYKSPDERFRIHDCASQHHRPGTPPRERRYRGRRTDDGPMALAGLRRSITGTVRAIVADRDRQASTAGTRREIGPQLQSADAAPAPSWFAVERAHLGDAGNR